MKLILAILFTLHATSSYSQSHNYFNDHYHPLDFIVSFENKAGLQKDFLVEFNDKYLLMGFVDKSGYIRSLLFCEVSRTRPDIYGVDAMPIGKELNRKITSYSFDTNKKILRLEFDDSNYAVMRVYGENSQISWEYGEHNTTRYHKRYKY